MTEHSWGAQPDLSDKLQLLHLLSSSPAEINRTLTLNDMIEGDLSDAIAICLQGSLLGDVTAVTLERCRSLTFVLMRNRALEDSDRQAAHDFFDLLNRPLTPPDILRFVMTTSTVNLNKARRKVATSPAIDILRQRLRDYQPSSLQSEFKISEGAVAVISKKFETTDAKQILSLTLDRLQGRLLQGLEIPISDDKVTELHRLLNTAKLLNASIFFSSVVSKIFPDRIMEKFKHRLEKLIQYDSATASVVTLRNRFVHCNGTRIGHRWAEVVRYEQPLPAVSLSQSPSEAIVRAFPSLLTTAKNLRSSIPDVFDRWSSTVQPSHHVEILLLCHMHLEAVSRGSRGCCKQTRMIGCSKPSCPCCHVAIKAYNLRYGALWQTSRTDGRSYGDWCATEVPWLDAEVQKWVDSELSRVLRKYAPTSSRVKSRKGKRKRSQK